MKPLFIVLFLLTLALLGGSLGGDNTVRLEELLQTPSLGHLLGTDELGRDILLRVLLGVSLSLAVAVGVLVCTALIGIPLGLIAGWYGGWVDAALMRLCDMMLSIPGFLVALTLMAVLPPGVGTVIVALSLTGWVGFARLTRAQALVVRGHDFMSASVLSGVGAARRLGCYLFPNCMVPLRVEALLVMVGAVVAEAGLSFLGLGVPPPFPSLGGMVQEGVRSMFTAPHVVLVPSAFLVGCVFLFQYLLHTSRTQKNNVS